MTTQEEEWEECAYLDEETMEDELVLIEGVPATPFHDTLMKLPSVRSYEQMLTFQDNNNNNIHQKLIQDCIHAFTARPKNDDEAYSAGSTFFVPCLMKARCLLEALALDIFHTHVNALKLNDNSDGNSTFDPERSGVEWWTLVMDAAASSDDTNSDDDVGMFFDADYGLEDVLPCLIHPHISTITYLTDVGAPTLILQKQSPTPEEDVKTSLEGSITTGFLSYPKVGKQVAFDGRLLHGAPSSFFPSLNSNKTHSNALLEKRVTFLVNIWFNHCPLDAELLSDNLLPKMTPYNHHEIDKPNYKLQSADTPDALESVSIGTTTAATAATVSEPMEPIETILCAHEVTLTLDTDRTEIDNIKKSSSMEVHFEPGVLTLHVGDKVVYEEESEGEKGSDDDDDDE